MSTRAQPVERFSGGLTYESDPGSISALDLSLRAIAVPVKENSQYGRTKVGVYIWGHDINSGFKHSSDHRLNHIGCDGCMSDVIKQFSLIIRLACPEFAAIDEGWLAFDECKHKTVVSAGEPDKFSRGNNIGHSCQ